MIRGESFHSHGKCIQTSIRIHHVESVDFIIAHAHAVQLSFFRQSFPMNRTNDLQPKSTNFPGPDSPRNNDDTEGTVEKRNKFGSQPGANSCDWWGSDLAFCVAIQQNSVVFRKTVFDGKFSNLHPQLIWKVEKPEGLRVTVSLDSTSTDSRHSLPS